MSNNRLIVLCEDTGNFIPTNAFSTQLKNTIEAVNIAKLKLDDLHIAVHRLHDPKHDAQSRQMPTETHTQMTTDAFETHFETAIHNHPDSTMSVLKKRLYRYFTIKVKTKTQGKLLLRLLNTHPDFSPFITKAWFDQAVHTPFKRNKIQAIAPIELNETERALNTCAPNWNLNMIEQTGLTGKLGEGVVVAVLDGGIRTTHTCFENRIWKDEIGRKGISLVTDGSLSPSTAHGTQVAALAVGKTFGVAPKATIMNVKITNTLQVNASTIAQAIHICTDYGVRIINISYSVTTFIKNDLFYPGHDQIEYAALEKNAVIIFSAGNDNIDASLNIPPNAPEHCIIVGGFNCDGALWHESATSGTNTGNAITVNAPANFSKTASHKSNTDTTFFNGTSAAAPHVAGLIAIMLSRKPNLTLIEIKTLLKAHTTGGTVARVNVKQVLNHLM